MLGVSESPILDSNKGPVSGPFQVAQDLVHQPSNCGEAGGVSPLDANVTKYRCISSEGGRDRPSFLVIRLPSPQTTTSQVSAFKAAKVANGGANLCPNRIFFKL